MSVTALAGLVVLWLASAYLLGLGLVAIVNPPVAHRFLAGFAQTRRANWAEAIVRGTCGLALVAVARMLPMPAVAVGAGIFLLATAALMPILPDAHRRIAARSVAGIARYMRFVGVGAIALGIAVRLMLSTALETGGVTPHIDFTTGLHLTPP